MRLADLFCKAGGAGMGYHRAGFEVVGVDIEPQPHYPFEFHQADALTFPLAGFDAVHASPPCQRFTALRFPTVLAGRNRMPRPEHPDLLTPMRTRFAGLAIPWVIENVPLAPGPWSTLLCGTMFGLQVRRHRYFQVSIPLTLVWSCSCRNGTVNGSLIAFRSGTPAPGRRRPPRQRECDHRVAMDVEWMTLMEQRQAIPPAYTEWIGTQLHDWIAIHGR